MLGDARCRVRITEQDGAEYEYEVIVTIDMAIEQAARFQANIEHTRDHQTRMFKARSTKVISVEHVEGT